MLHEIIFAGFGGQGMMLAGQLLAYAAMEDGRHVVWMPSYGPEMRGGTANCSIVVSDQPIASPIVQKPTSSVVMNNQSLERFGPAVKPGGILVVNSSLINVPFSRDDVRIIHVRANDIAIECGSPLAANMVALGCFLAATGIVGRDLLLAAVRDKLGKKKELLEINVKAIEKGWEAGLAAGPKGE